MSVGAAGTSSKEAKASTVPFSANPDGAVCNTALFDEVRQGHVGVCGVECVNCLFAPCWDGSVDGGFSSCGSSQPCHHWSLGFRLIAQELCFRACEHHADTTLIHQTGNR
jgi:hypothetical protein